jgi:single-stranded-DNA-specific exonuclease
LRKKWSLTAPLTPDSRQALDQYLPLEQEILYSRGMRTNAEAEAYLTGAVQEDYDPFLMLGMETAVQRLMKAIQSGEQIVVYGDFDADGVSATALLVEILRRVEADVKHYIPNRFDEGYGLNINALSKIRSQGAGLIVTVDCGIRAVNEVEYADGQGLDVIITDHHQTGKYLPPAKAIINPKQAGDPYPFKELAGVGLAYKLAQALYQRLGMSEPVDSLDLVAIGTVADLAPLRAENRILVRRGLEQLNKTERPGLMALGEVIGFKEGDLKTTTIGFNIGPRLNAAGRLTSAESSYHLLIESQEDEAKRLALVLEEYNRERQRITREMLERARYLGVGEEPAPTLIFVSDTEFNEGIVGLVASRMVDEFYRPAVVAVRGSEITRASGRSIPEFHITQALDECADLLQRYGGHSVAAGFSVLNENLDELVERLSTKAAERLSDIDLRPKIDIDAIVQLSQLDWSLLNFFERLEPCGMGNPLPILAAMDVEVYRKRNVGSEGRHLKLTLKHEGVVFDAIAFRLGHLNDALTKYVDLAFYIERNDYWGVPSLELNVIDIRPAGSGGSPELTVRNNTL